jgi:type I restriction enzyme S subunit
MATEWTRKKLGEVAKLVKESWNPTKESDPLVSLFSIPAFDMGNPEIVDPKAVKSNKFIVPNNSVLLSKINPRIERVWKIPFSASDYKKVASTEFLVFQPNMGEVDYLFYVFKSRSFRKKLLSLLTGSSGSHQRAKLEDVLEIEIPWPKDLETREYIGDFLGAFDKKIDLLMEQKRLFENLMETLLESKVVTPAQELVSLLKDQRALSQSNNWEELVVSGSKSAQLIENGWRISPLSALNLVIESGRRPKGGVKWIKEGVPSIGAESINGIGVFDFSQVKYVSEDFYNKLGKGKPRYFDTLLYKDGGQPGVFKPRIGLFGRGFPYEIYAINEHVFMLRVEELPPAYLYFWMKQEWILDLLREAGIKGAQPGINQSDVSGLPILIPPKAVLEEYLQISQPMLVKVLDSAKAIKKLIQLRDEYCESFLNGNISLKERAS